MSEENQKVELLYFWTESDETGFIREQGFNFSPNYRFELKRVGDGEKYELSCTEKEEYPNVWKVGNLANLTAVVGENGSGKSSLLRHLLCAPIPTKEAREEDSSIPRMIRIYRYGKNVFKMYHNFHEGEIQVDEKLKKSWIWTDDEVKQTRIYMTNSMDTGNPIREYSIGKDCVYFSPDDNWNKARAFFNKTELEPDLKNCTDFVRLQKDVIGHNKLTYFEMFATASYYYYLFDQENTKKKAEKITKAKGDAEKSILAPGSLATCNQKIIISFHNALEKIQNILVKYTIYETSISIPQFLNEENTSYRPVLPRMFGEQNSEYGLKHDPIMYDVIQDCKQWGTEYLEKYPFATICWLFVFELDFMIRCLYQKQQFEEKLIRDALKHNTLEECMKPLLDVYKRHKNHNNAVLEYYANALEEIKNLSKIWTGSVVKDLSATRRKFFLAKGIEIEYPKNKGEYGELCKHIHGWMRGKASKVSFVLKYIDIDMPPRSSGEKAMENIFSWLRLPPDFDKILGDRSVPIEKNILLLLDEVDLYMHPEWQRKFLNLLYQRLDHEYPNHNIQVVITTHSPLVLSDVPSSNTIYLKSGGTKCAIDTDMEQKESFGANLFTLLRDSFFLKGSMGEFAYSQISKIIDDLQKLRKLKNSPNELTASEGQEKLRLEECCPKYDQKISIIGEPMLKRSLMGLYRDVFPASDESKRRGSLMKELEQILKDTEGLEEKKRQEILDKMKKTLGEN